MTVTVVGKKNTTYTQKATGEVKRARELYVVKDIPEHPTSGIEGHETDRVWCGFPIDHVKVGERYDLVYEVRNGRTGAYATLVDVVPAN